LADHKITGKIEHYLAALSRIYAQGGDRSLQQIIVNAKPRMVEEWAYENYSDGHALYLTLPESVFLSAVLTRDAIQNRIRDDLNTLHNYRTEHVAEVFLEMEVPEDRDWRSESGLLVSPTHTVADDAALRIWGEGFRLFLSHKAEVAKQTSELKERLTSFGVSAFVAHRDIRPTREWQDEIENALYSMDAFVALMTNDFHESDWTDQEVGFALARGVPVIAVQLERPPYGFLGKFQALRARWEDAEEGIVKLLLNHERMFSAYIQALRMCPSWDRANVLARVLPDILSATEPQIDELVAANNENTEVRYSFGFRGNKAVQYGRGLIPHLERLSTRRFARGFDDMIMSEAEAKKQKATMADDDIPF
jgi:TIR domain